MTHYAARATYGNALKDALATQNKAAMAQLVHDDFTWSLPGTNAVSGETVGVDGMFERFGRLASFGVDIQIEHVLVSPSGHPRRG